jgi:hypothetical protein
MNRFEQHRVKLDALVERLKAEGMSDDLEKGFEELCSETTIAIFLGPNDRLTRNDGTEDREYPDEKDLWYYNDAFSNIDYRPFFVDESLGDVQLDYSVREVQGVKIPVLRFTYEKKWLFFNTIIDKEKKSEIDAKIHFLSTVFACKWYESKIEIVKV